MTSLTIRVRILVTVWKNERYRGSFQEYSETEVDVTGVMIGCECEIPTLNYSLLPVTSIVPFTCLYSHFTGLSRQPTFHVQRKLTSLSIINGIMIGSISAKLLVCEV